MNKVLGIALAPVLLTGGLVAAAPAFAATQVSFTTPGLSSWTVPDDVTQVTITAIGGAGGAGMRSLGGAGCTVTNVYSVTPGDVFRIFVGGGGLGGSGTVSGGGGGSTTINLQQISGIVAGGGGGGGGYDNVSPSIGPNDGGDGCGSFTSGGNGLSPNGRGGSNAVGGDGGGGDPTTNGGSGLAGAGGIGFGNPGSGGMGDVCSFGDGGTTISFGGGGGGGGYGGGGAGSQQSRGGLGTVYGGGGGGGSTGPTGATFSIDTARTANSLTGRNGSVLISFGPPDTAPSWFQSYARGASVSCLAGWNPSWAQWPGNGTGGYVCNREIYMTPTGTWSSRSQLLGSVVEQSTPAPAHSPARPVISYRC
jgi:hypothetical protein